MAARWCVDWGELGLASMGWLRSGELHTLFSLDGLSGQLPTAFIDFASRTGMTCCHSTRSLARFVGDTALRVTLGVVLGDGLV